jgi:uncharacterized protein (DUF427 family)
LYDVDLGRKDTFLTDRKILAPGANHPITISGCSSMVVVRRGSLHIAETMGALTLAEASYPPVQYVPRRDIDMSLLERSQYTTYCL